MYFSSFFWDPSALHGTKRHGRIKLSGSNCIIVQPETTLFYSKPGHDIFSQVISAKSV